jgi:hypothetical protein
MVALAVADERAARIAELGANGFAKSFTPAQGRE